MIKIFKPYMTIAIVVVIFSGLYMFTIDSFSKQRNDNVNDSYASIRTSSSNGEDILYKHKHYVSHFGAYQNVENSVKQLDLQETEPNIVVNVWLQQQNKVEAVQLEDYVLAVTMQEMPWSFQDEAIKAQMIAARTYIMYRLANNDDSDKEYDVTDSTTHQVYRTVDESLLTEKEQEQLERFQSLLEQTKGQVLTYDSKLIDALYFSTSNGKTEAAEYYFNAPLPYLKSVDSVWDISISPSYSKQVEYTYEDFFTRLKQARILEEKESTTQIAIKVVQRSSSNRIVELEVNGQVLTGRQFRELFGLASTDFKWDIDKLEKKISFTTNGYGHGVGMSQWGAEGMAREGYLAEHILQHYYTNIEVTNL